MCIDFCIHYKIDSLLFELAKEDEDNIRSQKGKSNSTTLALNQRRDFIGSLAQNGVFEYVRGQGIALESTTSFYDATIHQDSYDYKHRGTTYDIKGSVMGSFKDGTPITDIFAKSRFLIKDKSRDKHVGKYTFVKVDLENDIIHIVGVVGFEQFWAGKQFEGNYKEPCHYIVAGELIPFMDDLLAVT